MKERERGGGEEKNETVRKVASFNDRVLPTASPRREYVF